MRRSELLSTTFGAVDGAVGKLDVAALQKHCRGATRVIVVSAYYDQFFLTSLLEAVPLSRRNSVDVDIYLHGSSGTRLKSDLRTLRAWRDVAGMKKLKVWLVSRGGLFHTKLLVFEGKGEVAAYVGSANATTAAYLENEEIMLLLGGARLHPGIKAYVARVASEATPLDKVEQPSVRSLVSFFRTGDLYYKPNAVPLFRFDLRLPEKLREALSMLTEPITGFSAKTSRTYNPFAGLQEEEQEDDGAAARVSIRPFAIQTCFGWWAPEAYHSDIDRAVGKASSRKQDRLEVTRRVFLDGIKTGALIEQAKRSFASLEKAAFEHRVPLEEGTTVRLARFDEFLLRCQGQLTNRRWFERATRAFEHTPMPEIWTDPVARSEFEESFFDYLQYVNAATTAPRLLTMLSEVIGVSANEGATEIRRKLERHLRDNGWPAENWGAAPPKELRPVLKKLGWKAKPSAR